MPGSGRTGRLDKEGLEATSLDLLIANALKALRDPASRGPAVSYSDLERSADGGQRRTLRTFLGREYAVDTLPFDLAAMKAFRGGPWDNAGTSSAMNAFAEGVANMQILDVAELRPFVHAIMLATFENDVHHGSRDRIAGSLLVHSAVIAAGPLASQEQAAARLATLRMNGLDASTTIYSSALRILLRMTRRRPRSPYSAEDIVMCLHSLFDGYVMRHLMDEDTYPLDLLVNSLWDMALSMTERGFIDDSLLTDPERAAFVRGVLERSAGARQPSSREEEARTSGVDADTVKSWFLTDRALSEEVLDVALAEVHDLRILQASVADLSPNLFLELLQRVEHVATTQSGLVRDNLGASVWEEIRMLLEDTVTRHASTLDSDLDDVEMRYIRSKASQALDAARSGDDRRGLWEGIASELFDASR